MDNRTEEILNKLRGAGFEENLSEILEQNIQQGYGYFEITLFKEFDLDKILYQLRFEKNGENGYSFSGYDAQLFPQVEIEHSSINGTDTGALDTRMKSADWYYEYTDDYQVWEKGAAEIENIRSTLKQLTADEKGAHIAVQLWNNHVPLYSVNKPDFIHTAEEKLGLYPILAFVPGVPAGEAYARLKSNNLNTSLNNTDMNQKNYDYLKDQVKFTGFGDSLENELMEKIKQQLPEFTLQHQREFGKDNITATLHFKKPENSEVYFFNRYDLSVNQPNNEAAVNQTFFIGRENNFTLKEAYNMLAGRAVYKELNKLEKIGEGNTAYYQPTDEKYKAWVQLDFKNTEDNGNFKMKYFHDNYGFDLKAKLAEYPIKELNNEEERKNLLQSLEKGNRQSVTFIRDGKEQKQFIEASPQYKSINIYDSNNKRVRKTQKQDEDTSRQTQEKSKKQKQEQSPDEESGPGKAAKRSRKAKQGIS